MPLTPVPRDEPDVTIEDISDAFNQIGHSGPDTDDPEVEQGGAVANVVVVLNWIRVDGFYRLTATITQPAVSSIPLSDKQLFCSGNGTCGSGYFMLVDTDAEEDISVWMAELVVPVLKEYEFELADIPTEENLSGPSLQVVE